jgi:hypothetical protein
MIIFRLCGYGLRLFLGGSASYGAILLKDQLADKDLRMLRIYYDPDASALARELE